MPMEELLTAISQVGFPIAISIYLLIRFEQKMEKLGSIVFIQTDTIKEQKQEIKSLKEEIIELKEIIRSQK